MPRQAACSGVWYVDCDCAWGRYMATCWRARLARCADRCCHCRSPPAAAACCRCGSARRMRATTRSTSFSAATTLPQASRPSPVRTAQHAHPGQRSSVGSTAVWAAQQCGQHSSVAVWAQHTQHAQHAQHTPWYCTARLPQLCHLRNSALLPPSCRRLDDSQLRPDDSLLRLPGPRLPPNPPLSWLPPLCLPARVQAPMTACCACAATVT